MARTSSDPVSFRPLAIPDNAVPNSGICSLLFKEIIRQKFSVNPEEMPILEIFSKCASDTC
jgi:hypothetical protein